MDAQGASKKPNKLFLKSRKLHKWLMAFVGIQLFVWSLTGLYMVLPGIHYIHGDHLLQLAQPSLQNADVKVSFSEILSAYPSAQNIQLGWLGEQAVYRFVVPHANPKHAANYMLNASSGKVLTALSQKQVIALLPHLLNAEEIPKPVVSHIILLSQKVPSEIGSRRLPLWQVELDTWDNTTLYITQNSGEVAYVRHHAWRLFDALWRLHIMDYTQGEDISNKLLAFSSLIALLAILSGFILLCFRLLARTFTKPAKFDDSEGKARAHEKERVIDKQNESGQSNRLTWLAQRSHKWLALFVFAQLFLWVLSGFILGRLDHSMANGDVTFNKQVSSAILLNENKDSLIDVSDVLPRLASVELINLMPLLNTWVYQIQHNAGRHAYWPSRYTLLDAFSGEIFQMDENVAETLAWQSYLSTNQLPHAKLKTTLLPTAGSILPKEENPIWRVDIDDTFGTQVLIRANTGEVLAHYNDLSSWRNLLLKLHFMDYFNEGSFNNIFIKLFALLTLLLSLSGLTWLYQLIKDRQLSLVKLLGRSSAERMLTVYEAELAKHHSNQIAPKVHILTLNPNDTLLEALLSKNINIESICAGGGMCGKCVCQVQNDLHPTQAEKNLLSKEELSKNWRLACQHSVKHVDVLNLLK